MKRLLLISLIGLTCAQHAHAEHTLQLALQTAKDKFDSSLIAQATVPIVAGATIAALATASRAAYYHTRYNAYKDPSNKNNFFINTLLNDGMVHDASKGCIQQFPESPITILDYLRAGNSTLIGNSLSDNLRDGIILSGLFNLVYGFYKNGFKKGCLVGAGTIGGGYLLILAANCFNHTGWKMDRTLFSPIALPLP